MHRRVILSIAWLSCLLGGGPVEAAQTPLIRLVKKIQPTVATVIAYDLEHNIANIGTGFFINPQGHLVTNLHVLAGQYAADVRTASGRSYSVQSVVAEHRPADLLKLKVDIPPAETAWIPLGEEVPEIGERVVVVGSPMGLEQTVSEGIVSSVREVPPVGTVFQMSAAISPGSSGSPVVNSKGRVVGVATFQFIQGQNLNFAVTARQIHALRKLDPTPSVSEWTFNHLRNKPKAAEALCHSGFSFSVNGENRKALEYFRMATETDPSDADAWSGLGSCYAGLNHPEDAVAAYKQAIAAAPRDETAHFFLGNYLSQLGRFSEAVAAYQEAVAINPRFEAAYFNMGLALSRQSRYEEGCQAFESVIRLNPEAARAHYNAGLAYSELERFEDALGAQKTATRLDPDFAPAHYAMGAAFERLGHNAEGIQAYREALRADPDFAPAHYALGVDMLKKGDKIDALDQFKILKRLDSELADNLFNRIYPNDEPSKNAKRASQQPQP